ncbi:MAG: NAD-dependent epimerase/dehydratase family protein [Acidobacteria bacterium]|nr:NAD-dependent epimerase/dehydratase family protein [Acidobacteriota bacterium]
MKILVTGGAGFIGSAFVRMLLAEPSSSHQVAKLDKLTYAGNLENLVSVAADPRYTFLRADIADAEAVEQAFASLQPDAVVHFAAESHVDRSILPPEPVIRTHSFSCSNTIRTARSRTSGENLLVASRLIVPPSQDSEPPINPARETR